MLVMWLTSGMSDSDERRIPTLLFGGEFYEALDYSLTGLGFQVDLSVSLLSSRFRSVRFGE